MQKKYGRLFTALFVAVMCLFTFTACGGDDQPDTVAVEKIMLNISEYHFTDPNESLRLSAVVLPDNATDKTINWSNSDHNVVNINDEHTVVPLTNGSATITASSADGKVFAICKITVDLPEVEPPVVHTPVTGVMLSASAIELTEIGQTESLHADVTPFSASNPTVSWTSSDSNIVTVDENGTVTAVKEGTAVITVTTQEGAFTANCTVTVKKPVVENNNSGSSGNSGNSGSSSSGNSGSSGNNGSSGNSGNSGSSSSTKLPSIPKVKTDADHYLVSDNLVEFNKINSDVVAWLYVPGTNINFPVAQAADNEYYLDKGLDKKSKYSGSCYVDWRNELIKDSNTILYGHAKGDDIFDQLENVTQTKDWFSNKDNMYVCLNTLDELTVWQVFACYYIDAEANYYLDTNYYYDQATVTKKLGELSATESLKLATDPEALHEFMTDYVRFLSFVTGWRTRLPSNKYVDVNNYLKSRDYGVKLEEGDKIITLSTCADASGPIRYVLQAKLISSKPRP